MFTRRPNIEIEQSAEMIEQPSVLERLWAGRWLFIIVLGSVLALTVIALLILPVRYIATGSVIVAEQEVGNSNTSAVWVQKLGDPADLESQLLVIRSPRVMRMAMTLPGVLDAVTEECDATRGETGCDKLKTDPGAFIDYVSSRYNVGAVGRSRVINIAYQSSLPKVAQTMANALTNAFLDDQRLAASNSRETAASYLRKELAQLDTELRDADSKIQAFRRTKGLARGATAPISSERLTSISQQLALAEAARAEAGARLQEIKVNQARGASDAPSVLASRTIADLKQQLTIISAQLASQANVLGPLHPSLRALERERDLVQQRLDTEISSIAASAQKTFDANDAQVKSLRKEMDQVKSEVGSATSDEASIENMVRNTEIKRQQYADLYKRASELETERRVLVGSTRLVSLAELPSKPFFPKKVPFLAAGSTIGLMLALAVVLFGDRLKLSTLMPAGFVSGLRAPRRVKTVAPVTTQPPVQPVSAVVVPAPVAVPVPQPQPVSPPIMPATVTAPVPPTPPVSGSGTSSELSLVTGAPILARLPMIKTDKPESPIGAILAGSSGHSLGRTLALSLGDAMFQDALRNLTGALFVPGSERARRKVLLASPSTGEGKTFLTLALAQYLASTGRRVLIVECDLRSPKFENALSLKSTPGLAGILRGEVLPRDVVLRTATPNLDAIAAGPAHTGSADLLTRKQMSDFLLWTQIYDVVLIDGPSPAIQTDIGALARQIDGVLFCMRSGRSSIGEAVATTSAIRAAGGQVFGIAITMVKPDSSVARELEPTTGDAYVRAT
jgi:polysaccharide biosynthesis transport protein